MAKKIKITIFHCGFIYTGGGERIVIEEVRGLRKRGYQVDCYAPTLDKKACYPDIIDKIKVKTLLPQLPGWLPLRFAFLMVATCLLVPFFALKFKDTDLFIGANQPGAYLAWVMARLLNKPYLVYLNQPNRILYPRDGENWMTVNDYYLLNFILQQMRGLITWLDNRSILGAEKVLINGKFVAKEIAQVYQIKGWLDCPGGIHCRSKSQIISQKRRLKGKVKVNGKTITRPYVLLTSRHVSWKRFDWAIRAIRDVIKEVPEAKLIIPGAFTDETKHLQRLTQELGLDHQVLFLGVITQESLKRLYDYAAVYCFPSPEEDLGIVVLEAQAAAIPVVAWNFGGPTITIKNRQTGFLLNPYDLKEMSKRITQLLKDDHLREKMAGKAYDHVSNNFSWEKHVNILEKEIKRLLII